MTGAGFGTKLGAFLASAIGVYVLLSAIYFALGSYHEMRYWDALAQAPSFPAHAQLAKEAEELERAPVPISESMRLLATSGRAAFPAIRPESGPRPPLPGWIHHPDFKRGVDAVEAWRKAHDTSDGSRSTAGAKEKP